MNYHEIYDYFEREYGVAMDKSEYLEWFEPTAEEIYGQDVDLLSGAQDLIDELRDRGITVALVSSSPAHWIQIVVDSRERNRPGHRAPHPPG
jgi:beta-phosphoglucomutase-like phosphatase (HAD superfamily)